jgi:hypothetical protein
VNETTWIQKPTVSTGVFELVELEKIFGFAGKNHGFKLIQLDSTDSNHLKSPEKPSNQQEIGIRNQHLMGTLDQGTSYLVN